MGTPDIIYAPEFSSKPLTNMSALETLHDATRQEEDVAIDEKSREAMIENADETNIKQDAIFAAAVGQSRYADLTPWQAIKFYRHQFLAGASVGLGCAYVGYCQSGMGVVVANQGFIQQFGTAHTSKGLALDAQYISIWGAILNATTTVFHAASPLLIDRFGRRSAFYVLTLSMLAAILLDIFAKNWKVFAVAKLAAGLAGGFNGPCIMTYMSEVARPQYRGIMMSSTALFLTTANLLVGIVSQVVSENAPMLYRPIFYSEFFMLAIWLIPLCYVPESPMWLITKGRDADAKRAWRRLVKTPCPDFDHDYEFKVFREEVLFSAAVTKHDNSNDWRALFRWINFKRALAASIPFAAQQLCGTSYLLNYTTYFFQTAGVKKPFLGNTIMNTIAVACVMVSLFSIDRIGRRNVTLTALVLLGTFNVIIGGLAWLKPTDQAGGASLIAMSALWQATFSLSISPIGWVGLGECSSVRFRSKSAAVGVTINVFLNLIFTYTVPLMLSDQDAGWGQKVGFFFGGLSFLTFIPTYFLLPETKGRTVNEVDELYERGIPPRLFHKTKTSVENAEVVAEGI